VLGGILIHGDLQWFPVEHYANEIIENMVPAQLKENFCFHATSLFSDDKSFKGLIPVEQRFAILREFLRLIARLELPVSYGAMPRLEVVKRWSHKKPAERTKISHYFAFVLCAIGFQEWFEQERADEVAISVAAKIEERKLPSDLKHAYRTLRTLGIPGQPRRMLANFVDALHFAAPKESVGLQLADAVAFTIKRHLMGKEDTEELYEIIRPCIVCKPENAMLKML